ncbi:hypothetical protein AAFF_G00091980 [Aldrovandia affinis]|uniref:Uncharacterized protein n=1 Tax=Aldrovandia affinis TaxID=143900 RepID=A0AAD7WXU4_9TELE|nr:hypothetical protein AAFF_G00091980 [Aldrovandia affinis]
MSVRGAARGRLPLSLGPLFTLLIGPGERSRREGDDKARSGPTLRPLTAPELQSEDWACGPVLPSCSGAGSSWLSPGSSSSAELEILDASWRTPDRRPPRSCRASWSVSAAVVTYRWRYSCCLTPSRPGAFLSLVHMASTLLKRRNNLSSPFTRTDRKKGVRCSCLMAIPPRELGILSL